MRPLRSWEMIALGFGMAVAGWVLPVLMIMRLVEPSFGLAFLSHGLSVAGLFLGIIGAATYLHGKRKS